MDIKENFDSGSISPVEQVFDPVFSSVHASSNTISLAGVGTIGFEGPVSNRKSDDFDTTLCELLDVIFVDPCLPVSLHDGIGMPGSRVCIENLAEGVAVLTYTFVVSLTSELVE